MFCRRFEFTVESFASGQDSKGTNTLVNQMAQVPRKLTTASARFRAV